MYAIKNRLGTRKSWDTIQKVVQAPSQFESWSPDNPRRAVMEGMDANSPTYQHLMQLAQRVMSGQTSDPTGGATLFFNPNSASPAWAKVATPTAKIGAHQFMKE
jgi:spore germination cell wall hydrolase CwlJ-like protein